MTRVATQAEISKLAFALDVEPEKLSYLELLPATELSLIREAVYERLAEHQQQLFTNLAALVRWLPLWSISLLAPRFGPRLIARVAGELPAVSAAGIAERLPEAFLADVASYLDPRRVRDLIQKLSNDKIVAVALELFEREAYIVLGRFVSHLSDSSIQSVLPRMDDDSQLVRAVFYVESRGRLSHIVQLLPKDRLNQIILMVAEPDCEVMVELIALVANVSYTLQRELGDMAADQDEAVLARIVDTTQKQGLWPDLLPILSVLSDQSKRKVVNLPLLHDDPSVLQGVLKAAHENDLWSDVLPLAEMMEDDMQEVIAEHINKMPRAAVAQVLTAALMGEYWDTLLDVAVRLNKDKQKEIAALVIPYGDVDPALLRRLVQAVDDRGFIEAFDGLLPQDYLVAE